MHKERTLCKHSIGLVKRYNYELRVIVLHVEKIVSSSSSFVMSIVPEVWIIFGVVWFGEVSGCVGGQ